MILCLFCGFLLLYPGIGEDAAKDQSAAQQLHGRRDLFKQEERQDCRHHRLAELGGGYKGGGKELQAPAENAVAQDGGEDRQQEAHDPGAWAVGKEALFAEGAKNQKCRGAGGIDDVGVHRGGDRFPDGPAQEHIGRHCDGCQQGQQISIHMGCAGAGIGKGNEPAAQQGHGNDPGGFPGDGPLQKQTIANGYPDHFRADDGGGAGNGGMAQGFKPEGKVHRQTHAADAAAQQGLPSHLPQFPAD